MEFFECSKACFRVVALSLSVAVLPIAQLPCSAGQPRVPHALRQAQRIDQGVGGQMDLGKRDVGIFFPAVEPPGRPGTND